MYRQQQKGTQVAKKVKRRAKKAKEQSRRGQPLQADMEGFIRARLFATQCLAAVSKKERKNKQIKKKKTGSRPRATHFIALRLSSCATTRRIVEELQESFVRACPAVQHALTCSKKLHITLAVVSCRTSKHNNDWTDVKDESQLVQAFKELQITLSDSSPLSIALEKAGSFSNAVAFLAPDHEHPHTPRILELGDVVRSHMSENGFEVDSKKLVPHATILKTSNVRHSRMKKDISLFLQAVFEHKSVDSLAALHDPRRLWGCEQVIEQIELCSMVDPPADDGFYKVLASCSLHSASVIH